MLHYITFETPLGWLLVAETQEGIALVDFLGRERPLEKRVISAVLTLYPGTELRSGDVSGLAERVKLHILEYMRDRKPLPAFPVDLRKGTPFDRSIWKAIAGIPFGQTRSYSQIALAARSPGAFRAAGRACGRNPVPILIPCHRVVASGGKLGGFSGGLDLKLALLELERVKSEQ